MVVIDALRADFVLDAKETKREGRPKIRWLTEALERGDGQAWVARASPPTVTLPRFDPFSYTYPFFHSQNFTCRIKALTTGRISSFADVVRDANLLHRRELKTQTVFIGF